VLGFRFKIAAATDARRIYLAIEPGAAAGSAAGREIKSVRPLRARARLRALQYPDHAEARGIVGRPAGHDDAVRPHGVRPAVFLAAGCADRARRGAQMRAFDTT
jgi:hypothetical protein